MNTVSALVQTMACHREDSNLSIEPGDSRHWFLYVLLGVDELWKTQGFAQNVGV